MREGRNAYGAVRWCVHVYVCVLAAVPVLKRACKGEVVPSLASSSPFRKWAGCTVRGRKIKKSKLHKGQ